MNTVPKYKVDVRLQIGSCIAAGGGESLRRWLLPRPRKKREKLESARLEQQWGSLNNRLYLDSELNSLRQAVVNDIVPQSARSCEFSRNLRSSRSCEMKLLALVLVLLSTFFVICHGSTANYENYVSKIHYGPGSPFSRRLSGFWREDQWWIKFLLRTVNDDGDDFRDKWPKLELNWRLLVGSFIGFAGSALGSAGGVGGGGYYLTMLNLFVGFDAKTSTALSKSMVMGAAVAATVFNVREKHPKDDTLPVIDYSMVVLFQPFLLLGISIGVIFNVLFPEWLITVLFCILIGEISWNGIKKANKLSRQEKMIGRTAQRDSADYIAVPSGDNSTDGEGAVLKGPTPFKLMVVWSKLGMLLLTWGFFCALQISKLYVPTCSRWYWIVDFLQIPIALAVTFSEAVDQTRKHEDEAEAETSLNEKIHSPAGIWKYLAYALYGLVGGFIGGLLGVGGGAIMGPAFLELGLPPQVASATASFAMIFSSSLSVIEYWLLGRLPGAFAMYCISLAVVASFFGQIVIKRLVNSTGKASYIVYCLGYSVLASGVVLTGLGAVRIYNTWASGGDMGFHSMCSAS